MKVFHAVSQDKRYCPMALMKLLVKGSTCPEKRFKVFRKYVLLEDEQLRQYLCSNDGMNLFSIACRNALFDIISCLLDHDIITDPNIGTPPPLWQAVNSGNERIVDKLLTHPRINENTPVPDSTSPLIKAIVKGYGKRNY